MLYNTQNPHGGDIYSGGVRLDFSANTNPFGTPEGVRAAVCEALPELHRYPDPYCRELVSAIAAREGVPKGFVLCGAGAAELIYSFCEAARPACALELAPTFAEYSLALERFGTKVFRQELREQDDFCVGSELLTSIERHRSNAVFLCSPNNPTGRVIPKDLILRAAKLCARLRSRLFIDECFMDISGAGESFVPELGAFSNVTVLKAFTKSYGMAGLRLGFVLSSDSALLEAMSKTVQPWNVSAAAQRAGTAALCEDGFLEKTRRFIEAERPRLAGELCRIGLRVFPSDVNFLLFKGPDGLDEKLLERGIKIRNCGNFHGLSEGFYRICVRLPEQNDELISSLRECLQWQET